VSGVCGYEWVTVEDYTVEDGDVVTDDELHVCEEQEPDGLHEGPHVCTCGMKAF
jgi:hypothetical protein